MTNEEQFYTAFHWLNDHPAFKDAFCNCLDVWVSKVNPKTGTINFKDSSKNTRVEIWLECGQPKLIKGRWTYSHDIELDCGGKTFEEAIIKLAKLVKKHYGDYKHN